MGKICPHPLKNQGSGGKDKAVLFPKKSFDIFMCVQTVAYTVCSCIECDR